MPRTHSVISEQEDDRKGQVVDSAKADHESSTAGDDACSTTATNGSKDDSSDDNESSGNKHDSSNAQTADMNTDNIQRWLDQLISEDPWTLLGVDPSTIDPASNTSGSSEA